MMNPIPYMCGLKRRVATAWTLEREHDTMHHTSVVYLCIREQVVPVRCSHRTCMHKTTNHSPAAHISNGRMQTRSFSSLNSSTHHQLHGASPSWRHGDHGLNALIVLASTAPNFDNTCLNLSPRPARCRDQSVRGRETAFSKFVQTAVCTPWLLALLSQLQSWPSFT